MAIQKTNVVLVVGAACVLGAYIWGHDRLSMQNLLTGYESDGISSSSRWVARSGEETSLSGLYLARRHAQQEQDLSTAAELAAKTLSHPVENKELREDALRLLVAAGRMRDAVVLADQMDKSGSFYTLALMTLMVDEVRKGNFIDARKALNAAHERSAEGGFYALIKPVFGMWIDAGVGDIQGPTLSNDELKKNSFLESYVEYQLALINDMRGFPDVARKHYETVFSNPEGVPYRLVQALSNFYLRQGDKEAARKPYDAYREANPDSRLVPDELPDFDKEEPIAITPLVQNAQEGVAEVFFTTASLLFSEEALSETLIYLRYALYLRPDFPPAQMMLANLQEYWKDHAGAIETYASIRKDTVFYQRGLIRQALNYEMMGEHEKALRLLQEAMDRYPGSEDAYVSVGDIHRTAKRYRQAALAYSQAIDKIEGEPAEQDWRLFYARGTCYERMGEWDKAEPDLLKALELRPDQPDVLNYLGYSWLVAGKNVVKAKEYIQQALDAEPFEPHIIDSMGWAHYMMGEFDEAVEYLEQAANMVPQDATINDHLGDAYWRTGRKIEARFQWKRALLFEPEDAEAIQEKIDHGMPPFQKIESAETQEPASAPQQPAAQADRERAEPQTPAATVETAE